MVVVLEGLPGTGKSTLVTMLTSGLKAIGIPESVLTADVLQETIVLPYRNSEHIYMLNEELKSKIADHFRDRLVIMDRNYASTLALNYAKYEIDGDQDYLRVLDWYLTSREEKLQIPDLYIYLTIPLEMCNERKQRGTSHFDVWTKVEYLESSRGYYDTFFKVIEPSVRRLVFESQEPLDALAQRLTHAIQDII